MIGRSRRVVFLGASRRELRSFPDAAKREAGHQLDLVQQGLEPDDWKPMKSVGTGVCEIRIHDAEGAFRVMYVANLPSAVYVLHCFRKTSRATSRPDIDLASKRFRELMESLRA